MGLANCGIMGEQRRLARSNTSLNTITQRLLEETQVLAKACANISSSTWQLFAGLAGILVAASDGTFARDVRLHQSSGLVFLLPMVSIVRASPVAMAVPIVLHDLRNWDINASAEEVCESAATLQLEPITSMEARCQLSWPAVSVV